MRWWEVLALALAAALLLYEGLIVLGGKAHAKSQRSLGLLMLWVVGLLGLGGLLSYVGRLVFSPELGLVMIQGGPFLGWLLGLFMLGISLAAGLAWHVGQLHRADGRGLIRQRWLLGVGLVLGVCAASQVRLLGLDDMGPIHLYAYDLRWPPLLLWVGVCLTGCVLGLLGVKLRPHPAWTAAMLLFALVLLYVRERSAMSLPAEGGAASDWHDVRIAIGLLLSLPASMALTARALLGMSDRTRAAWRERGIVAVAMLLGLLIAILGMLDIAGVFANAFPGSFSLDGRAPWLWFIWALLASSFLGPALLKPLLAGALKQFPEPGWLLLFIGSFLLLLLGLSTAVPLLRGPSLPLGLLLAVLLFSWSILVDTYQGGLRARLRERRARPPAAEPVPVPAEEEPSIPKAPSQRMKRVGSALKALASLGTVAKVLLVLLALLVLSELPNARKTVIQPFTIIPAGASRPPSEKEAADTLTQELGPALSDSLLSALDTQRRLIHSEAVIQPGVLRLQKQDKNQNPSERQDLLRGPSLRRRETPTSSTIISSPAGQSAEFAQNSTLEIGGFKLPIHQLLTPLQVPLRALLGGSVLNGSLQEDPSGYTLMVRSSKGRSWKVRIEKSEGAPDLSRAISKLAERMAFEILSEDPALSGTGLTRSWVAFDAFRGGMMSRRRFNDTQDYDALSTAIEHFERAVREDPGFALASYHLGLALQMDGQGEKAAQAFRDGVSADPRFIPGHVMQSLAVAWGQPTSFRRAVVSPPRAGPTLVAAQLGSVPFQLQIAKQAQPLEQAQLYHGLCLQTLSLRDAFTEQRHGRGARTEEGLLGMIDARLAAKLLSPRFYKDVLAQAYFYCTQAERQYARVPASRRSEPETLASQASVLNQLGIILILQQMNIHPPPLPTPSGDPAPGVWYCAPEDTFGNPISPRSKLSRLRRWSPRLRKALWYYERAAALTNDPEIRCDAAMLSFQLGNEKRMASLRQDTSVHVNFAEIHRAVAKERFWEWKTLEATWRSQNDETTSPTTVEASIAEAKKQLDSNHAQALDKYLSAIEVDPFNHDALAGFAHTFWQWRYLSSIAGSKGPGPRWELEVARIQQRLSRMLSRNGNGYSKAGDEGLSDKRGIWIHTALGELHLARNEPTQAARAFKEALALAGTSPLFDAIRWDLAIADVCAAKQARSRRKVSALSREAAALLRAIRKNELVREDKLGVPQEGDDPLVEAQAVCHPPESRAVLSKSHTRAE